MFTNRRVIMPEPGQAFLGSGRARARARERRRRVFTVMLEALGLTLLIGLFPPLRAMWTVSAVVGGLLGVYVWMLVRLRVERESGRASNAPRPAPARTSAPMIAQIQAPEFPVIEDASGRRVVVISDSAARRRAPVAG